MRIVETDNFGGDYPNESFLNIPPVSEQAAREIANAINNNLCHYDNAPRFWRVVPADYALQPGFGP